LAADSGGFFYFYTMKFIEVRVFDDYISAHIIMGRLKEEDILCHLENEHTMTQAPFLTHIYGGIRLMVPEAQAERAKELLTQWGNEQVL
jgi:glutamate synthase domain-containing protein 3